MTAAEHLTIGPALAGAGVLLVLLHGRGQSPDYICGQAEALFAPGVRCVVPAAPGRVWYPLRFMAPGAAGDPKLADAVAIVEAIVSDAIGQGMPPERIVVLGFSQGGCLASEFVRRHPRSYGGVAIWTGGLIGAPGTEWAVPEGLAGVPVLVTGSDCDAYIPEARTRETAAHFAAVGARVDLQLYPGRAHIVSPPEVAAVAAMITAAAG